MSIKKKPRLNVKHRYAEKISKVGTRIKALRERKGFQQKALAAAAGISVNSLSLIENGALNPSIGTLFAIAEALAVNEKRFF